ncbi:Gag-pol fusion protein [Phytophthora cinnamomi]|uniref:Gag-pol fusion protein n=1 Tax=Phytophthora cinnamomi TaxID=4785 RepID=UPI00355A8D4D|nr:Gag-pol fusion protein [Phytophthora cinnamomi]
MAKAGLSLKASKCTFAAERLKYLGDELDRDGVRPMLSLVQSVVDFPVPTNTKEIKRFVHMAGYYRRFVPELASRASPMTKLLRKGVVWRWAEPQQAVFEDLKAALTERPLLAYPDFSRPLRLVTDASKVGLGATLVQDQGRGRLHRWALQLQEYDFEVIYRPGASNVVADALSRAPVGAVTGAGQRASDGANQRDERVVGGEGQLTDREIRAGQAKDRAVKKLRSKGECGDRDVVVVHGIVYIRESDGGLRVVLPTTLWAKALREGHDSVFACHLLVAAVDYATRYAVVVAVANRTATDVAKFIAEKLVFVYGPMREITMDGAPELNGKVIDALVDVLQAKQITPVPYRPALLIWWSGSTARGKIL